MNQPVLPIRWWCSICELHYTFKDIKEVHDHADKNHPLINIKTNEEIIKDNMEKVNNELC